MTASSFNRIPSLPILYLQDLVNWTIVDHALKNPPGERFKEAQLGAGIFAPSIRYHAGKYWIAFPMVDEGIYVTTADAPAASDANRGASSRPADGSAPPTSGKMTGRPN